MVIAFQISVMEKFYHLKDFYDIYNSAIILVCLKRSSIGLSYFYLMNPMPRRMIKTFRIPAVRIDFFDLLLKPT